MKFLTDENIATSVFSTIRSAGFDVKDIKEEKLFGSSDKDIINFAVNEKRIIITHDKDFVLFNSIKHYGVILLRFKDQKPKKIASILLKLLTSKIAKKLEENLIIVTETKIILHKRK